MCVRAAEGHASQVGPGINRHVNANEGWKISRYHHHKKKKKLFHNSYRKKVVFKSVSSQTHGFVITQGLFTQSGQFKITLT